MASLQDRLKEILLRDQLIEADDFARAIKEQKKSGGPLLSILVKLNLIEEEVLTQVLSEGLGLPSINIARFPISPDVIKIIPKNLVEKYSVMPITLLGDNLTLAMMDPLDIFVIDSLKNLTGYNINPIVSKPSSIHQAIAKYYSEPEKKAVEKAAVAAEEEENETFEDIFKDIKDDEDMELIKEVSTTHDKGAVEQLTEEAPIIKLTDTIIQQGVLSKASDVFIEPMENCVRIRYRIDGMIREIDRLSKVLLFPIVSRIKVISNLDISEHRLPQDGRFKTILSGGREVDFRVNVLPTVIGEKVVLRILDKQSSVLDVEKLGFEPNSLKRLKECAIKPHGMILTCGPTGSGKTTTLYSILNYVDSPEKNIVTVEDPVEYQVKGLNQVNIKPQMGLTFATSLRSILRQDPDIIMIGEIRDSETLDIAVKAALTGHLVLSSLHTTTAAGSVIRMMNMGIEPFLICSSVLAIIAQRLLRKICEHCKEVHDVDPKVAKKIGLSILASGKDVKIFKAVGCKKCFKTGYQGRVGITEILILSEKLKELILNRAGEIQIKDAARKEGMRTMREDALAKTIEGLTTIEEVLRVTASDEVLDAQ